MWLRSIARTPIRSGSAAAVPTIRRATPAIMRSRLPPQPLQPLQFTARRTLMTSATATGGSTTAATASAVNTFAGHAASVDVPVRTGVWQEMLQNALPYEYVQDALMRLHDSGMPWWATIIGLTVGIRLCLFPLTVYQMRVNNRMMASPQLNNIRIRYESASAHLTASTQAFIEKLSTAPLSAVAPTAPSDSDKQRVASGDLSKWHVMRVFNRRAYDIVLRHRLAKDAIGQFIAVGREERTQPWKQQINLILSLPIIWTLGTAVRDMVARDTSFAWGGIGWFPNLSIVDPYMALPALYVLVAWSGIQLSLNAMERAAGEQRAKASVAASLNPTAAAAAVAASNSSTVWPSPAAAAAAAAVTVKPKASGGVQTLVRSYLGAIQWYFILGFPIFASLPSGVFLYLIPSALWTLATQAMMRHPRARAIVSLPLPAFLKMLSNRTLFTAPLASSVPQPLAAAAAAAATTATAQPAVGSGRPTASVSIGLTNKPAPATTTAAAASGAAAAPKVPTRIEVALTSTFAAYEPPAFNTDWSPQTPPPTPTVITSLIHKHKTTTHRVPTPAPAAAPPKAKRSAAQDFASTPLPRR